jgi:hypothetical protein
MPVDVSQKSQGAGSTSPEPAESHDAIADPTRFTTAGPRPQVASGASASPPPTASERAFDKVGHEAHTLVDEARAARLILKEDLRMLVEKVSGVAIPRGPDSLAREQNAAEQVERDRGTASESAYNQPSPPPALARPVLMIPGLTMDAASFDPMAEQLGSTGVNGHAAVYVASEQQFHLDGVGGPVLTGKQLAGIKMFELQYIDAKAAPTAKQSQVADALAAIQSATGAGTIDVVTHSAGGTDFRTYLQDRDPEAGPKIGETVMIGPASHGTFMGDVGAKLGKPMGLDKAGAELAMHAPLIEMLNRTWDHQRGQIGGHVTIVAVGGAPTYGVGGFKDGDGYMQADQAALPDTETIYVKGLDPTAVAHLREVEYAGVIQVVQEALARGAVSTTK